MKRTTLIIITSTTLFLFFVLWSFGSVAGNKDKSAQPEQSAAPQLPTQVNKPKPVSENRTPPGKPTQVNKKNLDKDEGVNPDMSPKVHGRIDHETYLRLRDEYIALRRGIEPGRAFDPAARGRAIRQMEDQESRAIGKDSLLGRITSALGILSLPSVGASQPSWLIRQIRTLFIWARRKVASGARLTPAQPGHRSSITRSRRQSEPWRWRHPITPSCTWERESLMDAPIVFLAPACTVSIMPTRRPLWLGQSIRRKRSEILLTMFSTGARSARFSSILRIRIQSLSLPAQVLAAAALMRSAPFPQWQRAGSIVPPMRPRPPGQ